MATVLPKCFAAHRVRSRSAAGSENRCKQRERQHAYAEVGDKDQAFKWLKTAYLERDVGLVGVKTDFLLDSLHSNTRFAELVRNMGLPQ